MIKYCLGIDQSFSNTGITIIDENQDIVLTTSIPSSPNFLDLYKLYPDSVGLHNEMVKLYEVGLLDKEWNLTKKKKDLTKTDKELLKVPSSFRINFINDLLEGILPDICLEDAGESIYIAKACIESISFGSRGHTADLGRLLGSIERTLYKNNIDYELVQPTALKKFAGKGNYSKDEMIEAVCEKDLDTLKANCPTKRNGTYDGLDDRVDSYWLAKIAFDKLNN